MPSCTSFFADQLDALYLAVLAEGRCQRISLRMFRFHIHMRWRDTHGLACPRHLLLMTTMHSGDQLWRLLERGPDGQVRMQDAPFGTFRRGVQPVH